MNTWQLQEAKMHFSDIVRQAVDTGPQLLTEHGIPAVVLISIRQYQELIEPENNLVDLIQNSPLKGLSLDLGRSPSETRDIVL